MTRHDTTREGGRVRMATTLPNRHRWTEPTAARGRSQANSVPTEEKHACRGGCEREGSTCALVLCPVLESQFHSVEHTGVLIDGPLPLPFGMVARVLLLHRCDEPSECLVLHLLGGWKGRTSWYTCGAPTSTSHCSRSMLIHSLPPSLFRSAISICRVPLPPCYRGGKKVWPWCCSFAIANRIATRRRRLLFGARFAVDEHTRVPPRRDGGTWDVEGRPHLRTQGARHLLRTREGDHPRSSEGIRTHARIGGGRTLRMAVRQETKRRVEGSGQKAARSDHPIRVGVWRTHVQASEKRVRKKKATNEHRPISWPLRLT